MSTDSTGDGPGQVTWSFAVNNAALQFLADGQKLTQTYTVTVNDGHTGGTVDQLVTITITGTEDKPTITAAVASGSVTEDSLPTSASGTIDFADVDLTDSHTVSATPGGSGYLGTFTPIVSTGLNRRRHRPVTLEFRGRQRRAASSWPTGQKLTQTYTVTVNDGHTGGTVDQLVTITITGTEDKPTITAHTDGAVTEDTNADASNNLKTSGTVSFSDVDLTDAHTAHATFVSSTYSGGQVGALTAGPAVGSDTTGTGTGGSVTWNFTVSDDAIDFLGAGQASPRPTPSRLTTTTAARPRRPSSSPSTAPTRHPLRMRTRTGPRRMPPMQPATCCKRLHMVARRPAHSQTSLTPT